MIIYTFVLYNYIEKNNKDIKDGLLILHNSIKSLIENPFREERFNFQSFANNNQLDRGYNKLEFGDIGYISGLFSLFDNYENFCIKILKKSACFNCKKEMENYLEMKSLISISSDDTNFQDISHIINAKYYLQ